MAMGSKPTLEVDVAIIGGGWSGLVAAHTLALHNAQVPPSERLSFHIVEATDHTGGRTLNEDVVTGTQSVATEHVVELGGEWLAPEHTAAIELMNQTLGFDLFTRLYNIDSAEHTAGSYPPQRIVVNTAAGTKYCMRADQVLQLLSETVQQQVREVTLKFKELAKSVPCAGPLPASAAELDGISYDNWVREQGATDPEARNWLSEFADDAEATNSMSLLGVAWTYNCSNGVVGALDEDHWRVENGTQGPAIALTERLLKNITLNSPAHSIEQLSNGQTKVSSSAVDLLAGDVLVAGLSPPVYASITQEPPLPNEEFQLLSRLTLIAETIWTTRLRQSCEWLCHVQGTSLKYMVVYESAWWIPAGFLGKIMNTVYVDGNNNTVYVSECLDNSPGDCIFRRVE